MDKLEFLNAPEGADEDARVEEVIEPTPEPEPEAAAPEPVVAEPEKPVVPEGYVPLAAVLDTRDQLKEARARLAELEKAQQPKPQSEAPDPDADPFGYTEHQIKTVADSTLTVKLDISEEMARDKFGDETVDAARDWALERYKSSPAFREEVLRQRNPYGYVVKQFQSHQALSKLQDPSEIDAFLAWKAAQATPQAAPAAEPQPQAIPPRSIASAPSAGGGASAETQPVGPGVAYAAMFGT